MISRSIDDDNNLKREMKFKLWSDEPKNRLSRRNENLNLISCLTYMFLR